MKTYIALLRGINVGGHNKIKMASLRVMFEQLGYQNVTTYIQSGNVVFKTTLDSMDSIQKNITNQIHKHFGFEISVLIITESLLAKVLKNNPYAERLKQNEIENKNMYFVLFCSPPDPIAIQELSSISYAPEAFKISRDVTYLFAANGYGKTKLNNNFFEKKLLCEATTRNLRTMHKLLDLCAEMT